ncbi:hypothetical protein ACE38W_00410 [Chitinophaga sp. Hz27]|uniref:hypothetical protein n=1 Tax=Chitinophaga sp. Hz27 TaxID=3347169 RepID=UPI0035D64397
MQNLPNNCRRSEFNVFPSNWHTSKASLKKIWRIEYRFYDDRLKARWPKGYKKVLKAGLNSANTLKERQAAVTHLIELEGKLLDAGYNPILKTCSKKEPDQESTGVGRKSNLKQALTYAVESKSMSENTRKDIRNKIPHIVNAAEQLYYDNSDQAVYPVKKNMAFLGTLATDPISSFTKLHIRAILDQVGLNKESNKNGCWTNNNYNSYKKDLSILFIELEDHGVVPFNPVEGLAKRKVVKKAKRKILGEKAHSVILNYLLEKYYRFGRFYAIFSSSHTRETEFMRLKRKNVNLSNQTYVIIDEKGVGYEEKVKEIPDDVLHYWIEVMEDYPESDTRTDAQREDDFVFARGLKPGPVSIDAAQISRRWKKHIKDSKDPDIRKLKVTEDIYSAKHKENTDLIDREAERIAKEAIKKAQQMAAEKNSHSSTKMVENVYDVKSNHRELELKREIKKQLLASTKSPE